MHNTLRKIDQLSTPCCLIDKVKMQRNIERLAKHIGQLGCHIRPHVKTHKSIDVTNAIIASGVVKGITVSTLKEAEYFFANGINDILYAVGIVPNKLVRVADLISAGCDLKIILDNPDMAKLVIESAKQYPCTFKIMIELNTDGHRSGVNPHAKELINIASLISSSANTEFLGLMTHAGASYNCFTDEQKTTMAQQERELSLLAATSLREEGIKCPVVSVGSTPTAHFVDDLQGITEVRAGVYVFFDLVMAGLGVCSQDDIAISVLSSIIGHQKDKDWVITDAGWMAMSRDRGTSNHPVDQGYGLVLDVHGSPIDDYIVRSANQEHGILGARHASQKVNFDQFPLASHIRVLPNHACSTAAQFDRFYVVEGDDVVGEWQSISGW